MQKKLKTIALLAGLLLLGGSYARAEDGFWKWMGTFSRMNEVKPVDNKKYQEECGSCHLAYQPGLLPAKSWEKLLTPEALHNHFGEVADLDKDTLQEIHDYAVENAADKSYYKRSRKIAVATEDVDAPLRITDVRYIKRKHHDIPEKMIKGNEDVRSLSNCDACHTQAAKGVYHSDTVSIPNYPDY
jgi:hypothetical protein